MRVAALGTVGPTKDLGGMGLGTAMVSVSQAAKSGAGPFALNAQAPDEGNIHAVHWATPEQGAPFPPVCGPHALVLRDDGPEVAARTRPSRRVPSTATIGW
jgi:hypothetical protein